MKSQMGHTEAGAGALGAYFALLCVKTSALQPFTHLRNLNPYLKPLLESSKAPKLVLPKQSSPGVSCGNGETCSGISSFAFQVCTEVLGWGYLQSQCLQHSAPVRK